MLSNVVRRVPRGAVRLARADADSGRRAVVVPGAHVEQAGLVVDDRLAAPHRAARVAGRNGIGAPQNLAGRGAERQYCPAEGRGGTQALVLGRGAHVDDAFVGRRRTGHDRGQVGVHPGAPQHRAGPGVDADDVGALQGADPIRAGPDHQLTVVVGRARARDIARNAVVAGDGARPDGPAGGGADRPQLAAPVRHVDRATHHRGRRGDVTGRGERPFRRELAHVADVEDVLACCVVRIVVVLAGAGPPRLGGRLGRCRRGPRCGRARCGSGGLRGGPGRRGQQSRDREGGRCPN